MDMLKLWQLQPHVNSTYEALSLSLSLSLSHVFHIIDDKHITIVSMVRATQTRNGNYKF
jgi:hypothetical protein